jgi:hypothetical protein
MTAYPNTFIFRVTPEAAADLKAVAEAAGLKPSAWARRQLLGSVQSAMKEPAIRWQIQNADLKRDLIIELKRQGVNLNQLARAANTSTILDKAGIETLLRKVDTLYSAIALDLGLDLDP